MGSSLLFSSLLFSSLLFSSLLFSSSYQLSTIPTCKEVARLQHTGLSLPKGLWPFWKSQLPALLFAAEAEAGRLLPKPVKEGAEWEQIGKERPYPLEPDP